MPLGKPGNIPLEDFKGKRVLVTGHTGFKGAWLSHILKKSGADVYGYSLKPPTEPNLFTLAEIENGMHSEIGDIRDYDRLLSYVSDIKPEFVFHLAAQPLVLYGYEYPRYTYETNVMGTVNILECVRNTESVKSFLNVTTDKVYKNDETGGEFRETDPLDGYDPYSNSKSCSELVTHSYRNSFFGDGCSISTARAGNVIGGGDFSDKRIIPDCVRAALSDTPIRMRNPDSVRPYQHVLEPLMAYILIAAEQEKNPEMSGYYNVGPGREDCVTTGELAEMFRRYWGGMKPPVFEAGERREAGYLRLNAELIEKKLGFSPRWNIDTAMRKTVEWYKVWSSGGNIKECMNTQIWNYLESD